VLFLLESEDKVQDQYGEGVETRATPYRSGLENKRTEMTFTLPEAPVGSGAAEIGPAPYSHRSDCNLCRKQDGLTTGSALLDAPLPGGYIVEGEHFLAEHAPLQSSSACTTWR
jgi:hypothetical protein